MSLYQPKKDRCDICLQYQLKTLDEDTWIAHRDMKERVYAEKTRDKEASENGSGNTLTMDLLVVTVCSSINFNKTEADLQTSVFASCLIDSAYALIETKIKNKQIYKQDCSLFCQDARIFFPCETVA
ncbi:hypothetical protein HHI36_012201 [Cryptolaemus montrouzieri]|uniref:Uncharacterized protein n=1 Tax=Cryptolaemus montrouzieri TaxID=559131 RepID=A0ABD2NDJ0_9CUCU